MQDTPVKEKEVVGPAEADEDIKLEDENDDEQMESEKEN